MRHVIDYIRKYKGLILVILPAFVLHMLVMFTSGNYVCYAGKCGIAFWGAHLHDAIWHLSVAAVSFNRLPFVMPVYAGATLSGYNYLMDLVIYVVSKIGIPPIFSYFKLFPLVWFVGFTTVAIILARKIKNSPLYVGLLLFFLYFGGSFSYFLTLLHHNTIWGSSGLLSMQAALTLVNLQFAFSLIFLMAILTIVLDPVITMRNVIYLGLLTFINFGFKFYGGTIGLVIIGTYILLTSFSKKKGWQNFITYCAIIGFFTLASLILFYNPFTSLQSGSNFFFVPFAMVHPIIEDAELLYMRNMVDARYFLQAHGGIGPRLLYIESFTFLAFIVLNFGTRVLGFLYLPWLTMKKKFTRFDLMLLVGIIVSILLTVLFIQKGQWWNTIQFLYYGLFLANFFIARLLYDVIRSNKFLGYFFAALIILLNLPNNLDVAKQFLPVTPPAYVPQKELKALDFLRHQPQGTVYASLYDKSFKNQFAQPFPLATYDTAYVSAFSGKQTYLADNHVMDITGVNYKNRLEAMTRGDCAALKEVKYIYYVKGQIDPVLRNCKLTSAKTFEKLFENEIVVIYGKKI